MRVRLIGVVIGAGVLGVALAASAQSTSSSAGTGSSQSSASQSSAQTPSTQSSGTLPSSDSSATSKSSGQQMPSSQADSATRDLSKQSSPTQDKAKTELSGVVKKVDPTKRSVKISSSTRGEQDLTLSPNATIIRDGNQISLDQLKEGDQVRASFDATSSEATKINVESKQSTDQSKTKSDTTSDKAK